MLKYYTPIDSYYKLMKTVDDDPMFDKKRAQKKLRSFVESNEVTISKKAAMMVDHFHEQVIAKKKIGGQARAMVVTAGIPRCIEYYYAISKCLADRRSPYKAIVAFSGEHKYKGQEPALTSAAMNGFSDALIPKTFKKDPYRILIVADMFQTGFDEPLLHTMYVDKPLYDIGAVQTLSRLNRAYPGKDDTFVLDFANKTSVIEESFSKYYRTTILSGETDPNKLYDLIAVKYERDPNINKTYGRAWKRIRDRYAAEHPLCEVCKENGRFVPAEEVHHKKPISQGGTHARDNLMSLCRSCHTKIHHEIGDR